MIVRRLPLVALLAAAACSSTPSASTDPTAATTTSAAPAISTSTTSTSTSSTSSTTSTTLPPVVHYAFPVQDPASAGFADTHHDYPAADVFAPGGCGTTIVAPVDGTVLELRRDDPWSAAVDDPATRGGIFLSILGDDGVRYYLAHFRVLQPSLAPGVRVTAGEAVGEMGRTGRAGACHLHLALSPPCPNPEWWVRRGVVWPQPYLRDWQQGRQRSPADEVGAWLAAHPDACANQGDAA